MAGIRFIDIVSDVETIANLTGQRAMVKRLVNEALAAICAAWEWPFLWTESFLTTVAEYTTGTISVTAGSAVITGSSTTFPTGSAGRKIRVSGEQAYYIIKTRDSATQLTLYQVYQGTTKSAQSYSLFQDTFLLNADVDRTKLMRQIQNGVTMMSRHISDFERLVATPQSTGSAVVEMLLGRNDTRVFPNYTTGTVTISASSRTMTGGGGTLWTTVQGIGRGTKINVGQTIYTVNSVDSDTQFTVYEAATSASTAASYTAILDNLLVQLFTIPNVIENYYYRYQRIPAVLDADGDWADLPSPMHPLILDWVLVWLWTHKGFQDRAVAARQLYEANLAMWRSHYGHPDQDRLYRRKARVIARGGVPMAQFPSNTGIALGRF